MRVHYRFIKMIVREFTFWRRRAFHTPYTSDQLVDSVNTIRWIKSQAALAQHDLGSKRSYPRL